ncbi:MAG: ZIP family metal transporter [Bacillota bacterium]
MLSILFHSFLAGIGTLLGCILVLIFGRPGNKLLAWMLGLASGIMLAVIITDLLPSSYNYSSLTIAVIGFLLGNLFLFAIDFIISCLPFFKQMLQNRKGYYLKMGYLITLGIALHDLPEGIAIAAGHSAEYRLGLIIAIAIGLHNIPEGMAVAAPLKMGGIRNPYIILLIAAVSLITPLGAFLGIILVSISPSLIGLLLAVAGGAMSYIVKSELWPESRKKHPNYAQLGAFCGIIIMLAASLLH